MAEPSESVTKAIGMTFGDGARTKFKGCTFGVHAGNKGKEVESKSKLPTLPNASKDMAKVSEKMTECSLFNGVWMHGRSAMILSIFCKTETALRKKGAYLGNGYKRILPLPEELLVRNNCILKAWFNCVKPRDLTINGFPSNQLEINSLPLRKKSLHLYFKPTPYLHLLHHSGHYQVLYFARLYDCRRQPIDEGIQAPLEFYWRPVIMGGGISWPADFNTAEAQAGGQGQHIHHPQERHEDTEPAAGAADVGQVEESEKEYLDCGNSTLEQSCHHSASLTRQVGPKGGSIELDGCWIHPPLGTIKKNMEIEISVGENPCPSPSFGTAISRILKCKLSKMEAPIPVTLTSKLVPKPGKDLRVRIMSKTGEADWEAIKEITLNDGNIEYDILSLGWHVAVVSEEDEKNGEYHLFNDVWMHVSTGRILSVFWKDEIALENASKALEAHYNCIFPMQTDFKRILPIPEEIIVSVGDTLIVDIQCNNPLDIKMTNVDGSNARVEITHEIMKKNFITLLFRPNPRPKKSFKRYEVSYFTNVLNTEGQPVDGFSTPLNYYYY